MQEAYRILGSHGVRRLPEWGPGRVMLTVGDLVGLATDLERLVHPVIDELVFGHHSDSLPAVP